MEISREQIKSIKGIGIFLIMIHNFVDHVMDISCNEMSFSQEATNAFVSNVFSTSSIWYIFSFAGWIGVPLFFFLSGYGLTKKYGLKHLDMISFIKNHMIKLWKLLIPVFILYVLISHFYFGQDYSLKAILTVTTFTANFYGDNFLEPGVYWFFGVILQFYILFLAFRKLDTKWFYFLFVLFLTIYYVALYLMDEWSMIWIRHNFTGWGAPFILGLIAARKDVVISKKWEWPIVFASFIFLYFCLTIKFLIPLTEITFIVLVMTLMQKYIIMPIAFIGTISASIFVIHPFIRMIFYHTICPPHGATNQLLLMTVLYAIIVVLLSWLHHFLMSKHSDHKTSGKSISS